MNIAAMNAVKQMQAILGMDPNPVRLQWAARIEGEDNMVLFKRRREWLRRAGAGAHFCVYSWDELPVKVREKLSAV